MTLLDLLTNDKKLEMCTGIPNMATLDNIEFCVNNLLSAVEKLQKMRSSVKFLIILVMCKIKVNLYFSQLSVLFGITPKTVKIFL